MLAKNLLRTVASAAVAAILGCSGSKPGASGAPKTGGSTSTGTSASGGSAASATGGSASALTGGSGASKGGGGGAPGAAGQGTAANGGTNGGAGTSGGTGGRTMADGGAARGGIADAGGTGGSMATMTQSCKNPAHVIPMNPQNPQDGITLGGFYVDTDTWNAAKYQVSQTMYICDYDNWYVVANMNDAMHDGAVKTYPNVHQDFGSSPKISSFTAIPSSFGHTAPSPHVGIYEFAYDIWLNGVATNGSTEVMIWTDNYKQVPSGSKMDTVTFDGRSYDVYKSGSYIAFVDTMNTTAGTLELLSFFNYIIGKGWIPATSTLGAIDYGVELVSTDGKDATFEVNAFSLATK